MYLNPISPSSHVADLDAAFACFNEAFVGLERFVELNAQTVKTSLAEQKALADAALSAETLSEVIDLQSKQLPAAVQKTSAYWRHIEDIAVQTQSRLFTAMQEQFGNSLQGLAEIVIAVSRGHVNRGQPEKVGLFVAGHPATPDVKPQAIVDSSGNAVLSK